MRRQPSDRREHESIDRPRDRTHEGAEDRSRRGGHARDPSAVRGADDLRKDLRGQHHAEDRRDRERDREHKRPIEAAHEDRAHHEVGRVHHQHAEHVAHQQDAWRGQDRLDAPRGLGMGTPKSEPVCRRQREVGRLDQGEADLRAIPWVFAWSQARYNMTSWYGIGSTLEKLNIEKPADYEKFRIALKDDSFIRYFITNVDTSLARTSVKIMEDYAALVENTGIRNKFMQLFKKELSLTELHLSNLLEKTLEERRPKHYYSNLLRNSMIEDLHQSQIRLLKEWRMQVSSVPLVQDSRVKQNDYVAREITETPIDDISYDIGLITLLLISLLRTTVLLIQVKFTHFPGQSIIFLLINIYR